MGGRGDRIAALCRWSGLALPGDALTPAPGRLGLCRAHRVTSPSFADTAIASLSTLGWENSSSRTMAWSSSLVMRAPFVVVARPGRAQARFAARPSAWSGGLRPAGIGGITHPLGKGPETGWAGGWSADDRPEQAAK